MRTTVPRPIYMGFLSQGDACLCRRVRGDDYPAESGLTRSLRRTATGQRNSGDEPRLATDKLLTAAGQQWRSLAGLPERHARGRGTGEPACAFLVQQFHLGAAQARQAAQYPLSLGLLHVPEVPVTVREGSEFRLVKLE